MEVTGMRNRSIFTISTIALALCSSMALAQEDETGFFAKADTTLAHDDNIYRVTDDLAQSDTYLSIAPELKLIGGFGKQRFELAYNGDYAKFSDASDADYTDHDVRARINFDHTLRFTSKLEAGYQKEHEDPGTINRIQLNISEYNQYDQKFFLAGLAYGQENAIGRFALDYRRTDKDYTNNDLDFLDFVSDQFTARFTYRVAPNTRLYVEAIATDYDYATADFFELDNDYNRYLVGLTWNFTNKLTGDLNIGYQERDYLAEDLRDINGVTYNGEITWNISSYSELAVEATRESIDSTLEDAGGFLRTSYGISLTHGLTERSKLKFKAGYATDELVFISQSEREDDQYAYQMSYEYSVSNQISVSANYTYEERDSTFEEADFNANIVSLNLYIDLEK